MEQSYYPGLPLRISLSMPERAMRAFVFAIIAAVVLAVAFWVVLSSAQRAADVAFKTESVRN
jgi:hypothetical protein